MQNLTFTYTKENNSVSTRSLLVLASPFEDYSGVDISELDPNEANAFSQAAKELNKQYLENLAKLQADFDLKHNFRRFKATRMSDITKI